MERILLVFLVSLALLAANIGVKAHKTRPRRSPPSSSQFSNCTDFIRSTLSDRRGGGFSSGNNKCLGETYQFGLQLEKYGEECSVNKPKNESISLGDCFWTLHKCIAMKSLSGRQLSLENYADMMAGNLSDDVKSKIMSALKLNSNGSTILKGHGNVEADPLAVPESESGTDAELKEIKNYWKSYFNAEFQVCTNTSNSPCDNSKMGYLKRAWDYGAKCGDDNVPDYKNNLLNYNMDINVTQLMACVKSYNESHTIKKWTGQLGYAMRSVCELVIEGTIEQADLDKSLDFKFIYNNKIVSNFLSKSVKEQFFKEFRLSFAYRYASFNESIMNSESVPEIASFALEDFKAKLEIDKENFYYSPGRYHWLKMKLFMSSALLLPPPSEISTMVDGNNYLLKLSSGQKIFQHGNSHLA